VFVIRGVFRLLLLIKKKLMMMMMSEANLDWIDLNQNRTTLSVSNPPVDGCFLF